MPDIKSCGHPDPGVFDSTRTTAYHKQESQFYTELQALINCNCMENRSNTPDFVLAQFMMSALCAYEVAAQARDKFYSFEPWSKNIVDTPEA